MITARQFRNGLVIEMDKVLYLVLGSQHTKPGKGGAFVKTKLKNLQTGAIAERTFRPEDSYPQAYIEEKRMQYLYKDQVGYHFMDQSTYEQISINEDMLDESAHFLKDGMEISVSIHKDKIVGINLPSTVNLKVTYTEPGIKGDTAKGGSKPATVETGAEVKVPLFINTGDVIMVNTSTGEYSGRA